MTPDELRARKQAGLRPTAEDLWWLVEVCEALARGLRALEPVDFSCPVCRQAEDHAPDCAAELAEAALQGRWRVIP